MAFITVEVFCGSNQVCKDTPQMSNSQPSLDRNVEACDHIFCGSPIRSEVWQIADRIFSRGMRLVDIGCGTGEDAIHFAGRGIDVTAVDVSAAMIDQLKSKSGGALHRPASISFLPATCVHWVRRQRLSVVSRPFRQYSGDGSR